MDFANGLGDDGLALAGCAAALLVSGGLMWASYYLGRIGRGRDVEDGAAETVRLPLASSGAGDLPGARSERRRRRAA